MKLFWEILFVVAYFLFHAYVLFGVIYSTWIMRNEPPTWNPLPRIKLTFWWIPTFMARRKTKIKLKEFLRNEKAQKAIPPA